MQQLLEKEYELKITVKTITGKKDFVFRFGNATLRELIEFNFYLGKSNIEFMEHIFKLLTKSNPKFEFKYFYKLSIEQLNQVFNFFIRNYGNKFYNFDGGTQQKGDEVPFYSIVMFVIENTNETLESLMDLTWEKIDFMLKGTIWNINEKTKEGKLKNKSEITKIKIERGDFKETLESLKKDRDKVMDFLKNNS